MTHGLTSWRKRVSTGSVFFAMLPVPPRPVVTMGFFSVGVCRSEGCNFGEDLASDMLPAPPRPCEAYCEAIVVCVVCRLLVAFCEESAV